MRNLGLSWFVFVLFSAFAPFAFADDALIQQLKKTDNLPMLRLALQHNLPKVRAAAASRLGDLGEKAVDTIPMLVQLLADKHSSVRASSAFSLSQLGQPAIPHLQKALASKETNLRIGASSALSEMGREAETAFNDLIKATQDSNSLVRAYSVRALGNLGKKSSLALAELSRGLSDPSSLVRRYARESIQKIGADAIPTLLQIIEASRRPCPNKQGTTPLALSPTHTKKHIPTNIPTKREVGTLPKATAQPTPPTKTPPTKTLTVVKPRPAERTKTPPPAPMIAVEAPKEPAPKEPTSKSPTLSQTGPKSKTLQPTTIIKPKEPTKTWTPPPTSIALDGDFAGWHSFDKGPILYKEEDAKTLYPGQDTPTGALLHFFSSLLRKDTRFREVLSPSMKPALRKALTTQLPQVTKDLKRVYFHAFIARSNAVRAQKSITRRIAQGGDRLFGLYNVLFFVEANNAQNDVFVFLKKVEDKWYIQGIIAPFVRDILRKALRP